MKGLGAKRLNASVKANGLSVNALVYALKVLSQYKKAQNRSGSFLADQIQKREREEKKEEKKEERNKEVKRSKEERTKVRSKWI